MAAAAVGSQAGAEVGCCTYFLRGRDWCDHLLLLEGGTVARGMSRETGTWRLGWADGQLQLQLSWSGGRNVAFQSPDGTAEAFEGVDGSLECVYGQQLPLPQRQSSAQTPPSTGPRALLFSSVGSQCVPVVRDHWLRNRGNMGFDVALMFYKEADSEAFRSLGGLVGQVPEASLEHSPGMKWPNFLKWVDAQGGFEAVADRYDYIWVVDDDVRLETTEIDRMFSILREHGNIEVACPSFDAGSDGVWRYFDGHQPGLKLRYTDFVECTAPVLKASMLRDEMFQRCLRAVRTGCFIDFCFFPATGSRTDAVAIIDAVQCHHPPRTLDAPSEMRQVKAWEDHKEDDVFFEQEGVPREWYWFRQPKIFGGLPA